MSKTIGIISIKGGVGKTTVAASLASSLVNHFGKKVLLIDANYSAPNLGLHMDIVEPTKTVHDLLSDEVKIKKTIHNRYGVDVIPGSYVFNSEIAPLKLRDKIRGVKERYDFVILDSSPSLNDEMLSTILAADDLFVVTTADYPTLSCSLKAAKLAQQKGRPISGLILNKVREPKFELTIHEIEEATGIPVVAKIPDDKHNIRALFTRIPATLYNTKSKFSKEIRNFAAALVNAPEKRSFFSSLFSSLRKEQVNRQILKESFYTRTFN